MLFLVQAGSGERRPFLVVYHSALTEQFKESLAPEATIVNITNPPFQGLYRSFGPQLQPLPVLLCEMQKRVGAQSFGPVIILGFSEGCQAVRTQIAAGHQPHAAIAVDGIHASIPPAKSQITPWRDWFRRCGAALDTMGEKASEPNAPIMLASYSQIIPPQSGPGKFLPVRVVLEQISGWTLPVVGPGEGFGFRSGNVTIVGMPGADGAAHAHQLANAPGFVRVVAGELGVAPGDDVLAGVSRAQPVAVACEIADRGTPLRLTRRGSRVSLARAFAPAVTVATTLGGYLWQTGELKRLFRRVRA